ncbi:MAG: hypothetical protein B1H11_02140 [Desulfobacteraceae bacterium 4484_190.1]|nr:MAG: hypothetical protein B1H11_02140 [Desulfobacteraceae bacterium 4484_190.1]
MKWMLKIATAIMLIVLLVPGWLYASGNLPSLFPCNESIIRAINGSFPELANATFRESHRAFEKLRNVGVAVPYTYNEQLLKITSIRIQVIRICNNILLDQ